MSVRIWWAWGNTGTLPTSFLLSCCPGCRCRAGDPGSGCGPENLAHAGLVGVGCWYKYLSFIFLGLAVRAWADVIGSVWFWLIFLLALYLLAWALPVLHPKLSAFLWREQIAPEMCLGRGCLALALALLPVAGGLAGVLGGIVVEDFSDKTVSLILAIGFSVLAIGWGQAIAHEMWPKRPWAETNQHHHPEIHNGLVTVWITGSGGHHRCMAGDVSLSLVAAMATMSMSPSTGRGRVGREYPKMLYDKFQA